MKKAAMFAGPILIGFLVGFLSSRVQAEAIREWYPLLNKPALTPPNFVFPVAWGTIYVLMGVTLGLVLRAASGRSRVLVGLFAGQLLLNFLWCLVFFNQRNPAAGMAVIVALLAVLVAYAVLTRPVSAWWGAWLVVPYILWVCFATYLNGYILLHN